MLAIWFFFWDTADVVVDEAITPIYGVKMHGSAEFHYMTVIPPINPGEFSVSPELLIPISITRQADPMQSRFLHGTFEFLLLDDDLEEVTQAVSGGLVGKICELYGGYLEDDWDNRDLLFTGVIRDVELDDRGYRIKALANSVLLDRIYYAPGKSSLVTGISSSDLSAIVKEGAQTFQSPSFIIIDSEYIHFTSKTDNLDGTWTLNGLTRGFFGSTAATHAANTVVQEVINIVGDPLLLFFDLGQGNVSLAEMGELIVFINSPVSTSFFLTETTNVKTFIEKELLTIAAGYPCENNDGTISVKLFDKPETTVDSISDADCFTRPRWKGNFEKMVNHVIWFYDWNPITKLFESTYEYRDEGLIELFGDRPFVIESHGLRSTIDGTAEYMESRSRAYVDRFGLQLPIMQCQTLWSKRLLETGDNVLAQFDDLVNLTAGEIGFSGSTEIIGMRHNFAAGDVEFEVLGKAPIFIAIDDELHQTEVATPTVTIA